MANKDYWQRRFERLEQREMDKADKAMADLKRVYEYTLQQLRDEVVEWYTRYADETGLSLADARKQLDARELKAFKMTLKGYEALAKQQNLSDEYIKMLDQASIRARLSRSQMLYIKTAHYVEQLAKQQEINLKELLKDVYEDSYYQTAYETQSMQGAYDTFSEVPKASVEKAVFRPWAEDGKDFSERIWDNKTRLLNTLQSEITRTLIASEGTTLLAGRIANRFSVSFSSARRLAETETAYVQESARMGTWQKLHVAKYELVATLDRRTSPICRHLDGKVFNRANAKPGVTMPPFHCYCRTTTVPYIEGITDDDESTRAARDPDTGKTVQVPGKMKYDDWKAVYVDKTKTLEEWKNPASGAVGYKTKPQGWRR
ncbi:minor capsid protein, partial [uncultured Megasphaera sp.]|uniref:minor capsid protein n=1 Tax=uncultured Megasphaera sp. TaxID=165188 RepID=UPI0026589CEB